jgi:hypothetical protein
VQFIENLQRIYREFTENLQRIYREFTENLQRVYREFMEQLLLLDVVLNGTHGKKGGTNRATGHTHTTETKHYFFC